MTTLLIILFILFIGIPVFRAWRSIHDMRKKVNESFGGRQRRNDSGDDYETTRKRYTDKDGEYAEFEDVTGPATEEPAPGYTGDSRTVVEEQVTDAEFEEVP